MSDRTSNHSLRRAVAQQAFTLVELIVVVSMISMLLAMFMPIVTLARGKARGAQCVNNLRQIGIAMENYRDENDDRIPVPLVDSAMSAQQQARASTQWSILPAAYAEAQVPPGSFAEYCGDPRILTCPSSRGGIESSYGLNGQVINVVSKFRLIPNPGETPLVFDCNKPVGYNYSDLDPRHVGSANVLFADTHIEPRFYDTLYHFASAIPLPGVGSGQTDLFTLSEGTVTAHQPLTAYVVVLGAAFQNGVNGPRIPVSAGYALNGSSQRVTSDAYYGGSATVQNLQPGDTITIQGQRNDTGRSYKSDDGSGHVWSLLKGNTVPSIAGYAGQPDIESYVRNYVGNDGKVNIDEKSVIYLFELSSSTDYQHDSWADFQDLVVLVTFSPAEAGSGPPSPPAGATFTIEVRITGSPWDSVGIQLLENGAGIASTTMLRLAGNPAEQTVTLGTFTLDPNTKTYKMSFALHVGHNDGSGGGNPLWIRVNGGSWQKVVTVNKNNPNKTVDVTGILKSAM